MERRLGLLLLYDLANAHVVLSNGFVESWKDGFLSSEAEGGQAHMQQLKTGMDAIPQALQAHADAKLTVLHKSVVRRVEYSKETSRVRVMSYCWERACPRAARRGSRSMMRSGTACYALRGFWTRREPGTPASP
jgi:hypothetical protein